MKSFNHSINFSISVKDPVKIVGGVSDFIFNEDSVFDSSFIDSLVGISDRS
jgi:hypothetical protein